MIVGLRLQRNTRAFNFESPKLSLTYLHNRGSVFGIIDYCLLIVNNFANIIPLKLFCHKPDCVKFGEKRKQFEPAEQI